MSPPQPGPGPFTVGVEEEFLVVDAQSHQLRPDGHDLVARARGDLGDDVSTELLQAQVETGTSVCASLHDVRRELGRLRRDLASVAAGAGCAIAASGSYPAEYATPPVTENERYQRMAGMFGPTARDQLSCGCHVHVAVGDRELAVAVLRRARPWLPVLLALTANSPFLRGEDTGYASYRSQVWSRWPTAGPPPPFQSRAEYDEVVEALLATGVLRDRGMIYWQVRPSERYETLEFRVADVCLSVDDAVLLAGLVRALARTCAEQESAGVPLVDVRPEVLHAATWRAARFGLDGELVDPDKGVPVPAAAVLDRLVEHVRPALDAHGDVAEVTHLLEQTLSRGTGAARQRAAYRRRASLADVLQLIVTETAGA